MQTQYDEHIPVGRPRPTAAPISVGRAPAVKATAAGELIMLVLAIFVAGGWGIGHALSLPLAGAILGGFGGVVTAFIALYYRYRDI